MKFTKRPIVTYSWQDHKNRCMEYDVEFRVAIGYNDIMNLNSICENVVQILMFDPRRSESFPVNS